MDDISLWWIALGGGLVVLLAVFALLSMLYRSVRKVESAVTLVEIGGSVGANTAKIRDLLTTAWVLNQIRDEALVHDEFLSSQ